MSAMPARVPERSVGEVPAPPTVRPGRAVQRRAERRAEMLVLRRFRRHWALVGISVIGALFALTVGILDVLH